MTLHELLHGGANAALILTCTIAGSYALLVLIVLIKPNGARGKAARDLLTLHPLSKKNQDDQGGQDHDTNRR
ncbi:MULTISPECIES: hypothetical protein [unclassified Streptomyces]|uniref:hypothetical protein n=1 Tax=unclassified Streptomyces TaxID=2593676 RepID=UPI000B84FF46|nr:MULTISPECIES: hypothetical protein [unclassified Streptomyces]